MDNIPLLAVEKLSVCFHTPISKVNAVHRVDFTLERGETLVILGESGSGKSVSASVIMDILDSPPGEVTSGAVRFKGQDLLSLKHKARRALNGSKIAIIFQDPLSHLNPVYTVGWQVAEVINIHNRGQGKRKDAEARALALLEKVGIPDAARRYHHYPHQFSGGQRQRVMIAMALALSPELLIADEPTTALDVTVQRQILDLLKQLQAEFGMGIIMITHDLTVAATMADKIAVMRNGEVVESGPIRDVVAKPSHPYTRRLLSAIPRLEEEKHAPLAAGTQRPIILEVDSLSKDYFLPSSGFRSPTKLRALDDVTFTLEEGTTLGVVGESGSGKSTLARILMNLDAPSAGVARFREVDIFRMTSEEMSKYRRQVQMVFQDPFGSLNPTMSIREVIGEPLAIHKTIRTQNNWDDRIVELLELVGLQADHRFRYPHQFSGGQRQRIAIARALASEPRLVVCDEAVSALDVEVQVQIIELLAELRDRLGLSYIFITHDLPIVRSLADTLIVMKDGRVVEQGAAETLFTNPQHAYTRNLLDASEIPAWMSDAVRSSGASEPGEVG